MSVEEVELEHQYSTVLVVAAAVATQVFIEVQPHSQSLLVAVVAVVVARRQVTQVAMVVLEVERLAKPVATLVEPAPL